jgi:hypothetical protein
MKPVIAAKSSCGLPDGPEWIHEPAPMPVAARPNSWRRVSMS